MVNYRLANQNDIGKTVIFTDDPYDDKYPVHTVDKLWLIENSIFWCGNPNNTFIGKDGKEHFRSFDKYHMALVEINVADFSMLDLIKGICGRFKKNIRGMLWQN